LSTQYDKSQRKIKKIIKEMSGKYRQYQIFRDFIVLSACTISNSVDKQQWQAREKMYMDTIKKYTKEEADKFAKMLALMTLAYESKFGDFIGELYMTMEFGNDDAGQFFTPYHVSQLMAELNGYNVNGQGTITLNDPACGSGGLIVAYAEAIHRQELNYQTMMRVTCNDIDFDVVKMCYVQLSLLGIDAVVMQGDTMTQKMNEVWLTPMHFINRKREQQEERTTKMVNAMRELLGEQKEEQLTLF